MKRKDYLALFILGLVVTFGASVLIHVPGYMDAEYYYSGGTQLAQGQGFNEPFLWNYLDDPSGIPHPSHTYWMPLTSILASLGMVISGKADFASARIFFILIAALIPGLTAFLSWRLCKRRLSAWLAGGLAIIPGFYGIYMGITDTFAVYMLLGTLFLILAVSPVRGRYLKYLGLGLLAGLMHLARADGILWLFGAGLLLLFELSAERFNFKRFSIAASKTFICLGIGYLAIMAGWYVRNISFYGSLFSPAGSRVLWLTNYDQMFAYPASSLNFNTWLANGLGPAVSVRWAALVENLQTVLAVQAEIFLFPFILVGLWRLRKEMMVRLGSLIYAGTFLVMTFVFPLAGGRGGFFHSGAAIQPLLWAAAAEGLIGLVEWSVRLRKTWKFERASRGFGFLMLLISGVMTLALFVPQVIPNGVNPSAWDKSSVAYQQVDQALTGLGVERNQIIAVNNPPGFFVASGRPAIVIPDGPPPTMLAAAKQFKATYLILEANSVTGLRDLYAEPHSIQGLEYLKTVGQIQIFKFIQP
jgi:hypothetical protein